MDFAVPSDVLDMLREGTRGHQLIFPKKPVSSVLVKAEPDPQFSTADIAFGQPDLESVAGAVRLKWIHISTSSITRYDNPKFRALVSERQIAVSNSASVYNEACAVHALSFMLAQARNLPRALASRAPGGTDEWFALRSTSGLLRGQTVLIAGYGAIGKRLIELLHPFHMNVIAYRRKARGDEGVQIITKESELVRAAGEADHIIDIFPDSAETRNFFNANRFAAFKPGAIFYNIGRGTTVDQDALLNSLRTGRIKAAWLDVTEPEPLPDDHPLRAEPHCFITPHVAGGHENETQTLVRHFLKNLERFIRGEPLLDRVM